MPAILIVKCHPFYLPREFTWVIVSAFYIPPQNICELHEALTQHPTHRQDAALIVPGTLTVPNSNAQCQTSINTSPAPPGVKGSSTIATLHSKTATRHSVIHCLGNQIMPPSSSCPDTNKGWNKKLRFRGRSRAGQTNQWLLCRTR